MVRSELVDKIARENPGLSNADAERVVRIIFDAITEKLAEGGRVELRNFGAFSVKHRDPRLGRDPRTGDPVDVEAKAVPFFKTGKEMRVRMNDQ